MAGGGETLGFACNCGQLRGELHDITPAAYTYIICHCHDCRAAYTHLGLADPEKVAMLQTTQDRVHITQGGENLRVFRHTPKGALRWYATCCDTPLFCTPLKGRLVHASIHADRLDRPDSIGKVMAEGFIPGVGGKKTHKNMGRMVTRILSRMAAKNLSGEWRGTPFFDDDGAPAVQPNVLTREERAAALMGVGK